MSNLLLTLALISGVDAFAETNTPGHDAATALEKRLRAEVEKTEPDTKAQTRTAPYRVCFFSLNNPAEAETLKQIGEAMNKATPDDLPVLVEEHQIEGTNPATNFESMARKMLKDGTRCDALVISGHHTGAFGGGRADGTLDIEFLERISCDPELESWFRSVRAVWLSGCRTMGVKIQTDNAFATDASGQAERVAGVAAEDNLTGGRARFEFEFSSTLDQDNPLSSRYLRVFPRSMLFGWTKTAPGVQARSENSIPYHLMHMANLAGDNNVFHENPSAGNIRACSATGMKTALKDVINQGGSAEVRGRAIQAWNRHGNLEKIPNCSGLNVCSFNNPDLKGSAPYCYDDALNQELGYARKLDCILKRSQDPDEIEAAVRATLKDTKSLGYLYNSLVALVADDSRIGPAQRDKIRGILKGNPRLLTFLKSKILSPTVGGLPKIEYYALLRDILGTPDAETETEIWRGAKAALLKRPPENVNYDVRDYKQVLIQSLAKHNILTEARWNELFETMKSDDELFGLSLDEASRVPAGRNAIPKFISALPNGSMSELRIWALDRGTHQGNIVIPTEEWVRIAKDPIDLFNVPDIQVLQTAELVDFLRKKGQLTPQMKELVLSQGRLVSDGGLEPNSANRVREVIEGMSLSDQEVLHVAPSLVSWAGTSDESRQRYLEKIAKHGDAETLMNLQSLQSNGPTHRISTKKQLEIFDQIASRHKLELPHYEQLPHMVSDPRDAYAHLLAKLPNPLAADSLVSNLQNKVLSEDNPDPALTEILTKALRAKRKVDPRDFEALLGWILYQVPRENTLPPKFAAEFLPLIADAKNFSIPDQPIQMLRLISTSVEAKNQDAETLAKLGAAQKKLIPRVDWNTDSLQIFIKLKSIPLEERVGTASDALKKLVWSEYDGDNESTYESLKALEDYVKDQKISPELRSKFEASLASTRKALDKTKR